MKKKKKKKKPGKASSNVSKSHVPVMEKFEEQLNFLRIYPIHIRTYTVHVYSTLTIKLM